MADNADRHKAKMANRKAVQDAEVASKPILEKGLLIVHTGPGKGKSTAAFGLALRALGRGFRVAVVQFIKGAWSTGERMAVERFGAQVEWRTMGEGFTWETQDRARDVAAASAAWAEAKRMMADPSIRLLVLDELNIALRYDYLPLAEVVAALVAAAPRPACRRDRPQRQAGADRGGRLRDRVRARQASLRRWRAGAGGDRILTARALMFQGTGSDVGKSLIVAGLSRAFCEARASRPPVQAAEHVEQRRGDRRRRRDRPRSGFAGARVRSSAERAHEPGALEAAERSRRAGCRPGQGRSAMRGRANIRRSNPN